MTGVTVSFITSDDLLTQIEIYKEKDELLTYFEKNQRFPDNPANPNSGKTTPFPVSVTIWFVFWMFFAPFLLCIQYTQLFSLLR
jgi:hypothetical protein